MRNGFLLSVIMIAAHLNAAFCEPFTLANDTLTATLSQNPNGAPQIIAIQWNEDGTSLLENAAAPAASDLPSDGLAATPEEWHFLSPVNTAHAESAVTFKNGLVITWVAELPLDSPWLKLYARMTNTGTAPAAVQRFPVWEDAWQLPGRCEGLRWWESLSFQAQTRAFEKASPIDLFSHVHSSDDIEGGVNPYWEVWGKSGRAYFALDWCGGWRAHLETQKKTLAFRTYLPEDETQLTLAPGETIEGPALHVVFTRDPNETASRAQWMRLRQEAARTWYGGPAPAYPFCWNHWYAVRFNVDEAFLTRQAAAMLAYGFDYFVVDAGWYRACGDWTPDPAKFSPGSFTTALGNARAVGAKTGIWSCPQFLKADPAALPPNVDQPGFYRDFIDGWLLDLARPDFTKYLLDHVSQLRKEYGMAYWKFDQDFFTANATRAGRMKDVCGLQKAMLAVRKAEPDLFIESCQSGGRMLNEFTVLMAQGQWIADGGKGGLDRARRNWLEATNTLAFLPPYTVIRWINRPDEQDQNDDEFTRMYCRSAMAGVWGIVADLDKIGDHQRAIILEERDNYTRLNTLKNDCLYDLYPAAEKAPAAGVVYFDKTGSRAAVLLLRWNAKGAFTLPVSLKRLDPHHDYTIALAGSSESIIQRGATLQRHPFKVSFSDKTMSQLIFINTDDGTRQ